MSLLAAVAAFLGAGSIFLLWEIGVAPNGVEDENGFHEVKSSGVDQDEVALRQLQSSH